MSFEHRRYLSHEESESKLTLAVAVAGCASTVGVRALTAATHVDWSEELVVGKRFVLV